MSARVLIVDDDAGYARALRRTLEREGHEVSTAGTAAAALSTFEGAAPEVVILDYQLPDADGLSLLDQLRPRASGAVFLLNTAYPDLDVAVEAMRRGAFDFLAKDRELRECLMRIERAVDVVRLRRRVVEAGKGGEDGGLLGDSPAMRKLHQRLDALASSGDTTAFIVGETGTGKGVIARRVHAQSPRSYEPFVPVDCTTIPATLVESELFGHERGAFSGATHSKTGRVEVAARGTLFLDEIGELELPMQAKLLRLLEEREFTRVGGTKAQRLEARIIAATNRDLARAVAEGRFRPDLRYRLEVFVLEVPPLRERGEDIFLLASHFARERARALGRDEPRFSDRVLRCLASYPFPGNVRELRNMVEQAVLLSETDVLGLDEFPVLTRVAGGWTPPKTVRPPARSEPPAALAPPASALLPHRLPGPPGSLSYDPRSGDPRSDDPRSGEPRSYDRSYDAGSFDSLDPRSPDTPSYGPSGGWEPAPPAPRAPAAETASTADLAGGPAAPATPDEVPSLDTIRRGAERAERDRIVAALRQSGGNVSAAARRLGMSRYQVLRRLDKYDLR